MDTRRGSILDPRSNVPVVGGNHETCQRVADAIFKALVPVAAEKLSAGGPTTAGLLIFSARNSDGDYSTFYEVHGGGEGARVDRDGMAVTRVHLANVMSTPVEVIETEYPIMVERQALRPTSGGAGAHRGGDGLHRVYRMLANDVSLTTMFERAVVPPYGLEGGEDGALFEVHLETKEGTQTKLPGKHNVTINTGDRVTVLSCGGGGYGVQTD